MSSRLQLTAVSALHHLSLHHHPDHHDDQDHDGDDCDDDDDDSDISCIMIMIAIMMVTMMDTMVMIMTMRMVVPWYHQLPMPNLPGQACGQATADVVNAWHCLHLGCDDGDGDGDDAMCQRPHAV